MRVGNVIPFQQYQQYKQPVQSQQTALAESISVTPNLVNSPLASLGKSQVRFGNAIPNEFDFLNQKFLNAAGDLMTAGDILLDLITNAKEFDGKESPIFKGTDGKDKFFYSQYQHHLYFKLQFSNPAFGTLLDGFLKLGFINPKPEEKDPLTQEIIPSPSVWHKATLSDAAYKAGKAWEAAKAAMQTPSTTLALSDGLEYTSGPKNFLGKSPEEILNSFKFPADAMRRIQSKIKLAAGPKTSSETQNAETSLEWIFSLPWINETKDKTDIVAAKKIFESNFYGMEDVQNRLLEEIAVRNFKGGNRGGIILLVGPPGVGKTAATETLAKMLGRKFTRRSLAGVHDAALLHGHKDTYVGAKPGLIVQGMIESETKNPVFQLDEVDKMSTEGGINSSRPMDALLPILDPQQNDKFEDHYLDFKFDLSKVLFVLTANSMARLPEPLISRTEVIYLGAYMPEEKIEIAKQHLIPKSHKKFNISEERLKIPAETIEHLINHYTVESGVRKLEERIDTLFRKSARYFVEQPMIKQLKVTPTLADQWLSNKRSKTQVDPKKFVPGLVNGLYYSTAGGGTLPVQVSLVPGPGGTMMTGSLGQVMREAAAVVLSTMKTHAKRLNLSDDAKKILVTNMAHMHIHYPDAAVPKDGPSAGVSTFLAVWSALTEKPVPQTIGLTGEIDLHGNVKAIGGILEKLSGGMAQGLNFFILPEENRKDFDDLCKRSPIFKKMTDKVQVHFVKTLPELVELVEKQIPADQLPKAPSQPSESAEGTTATTQATITKDGTKPAGPEIKQEDKPAVTPPEDKPDDKKTPEPPPSK